MKEALFKDDILQSKLILIVDDEPRMVDFIRMNLEVEGCEVIEAHHGLEAIERVRTDLPDLVLLDVMMETMDGFEALEAIRQTSDVPVIMLTVRADEEDRIAGLELGADDYLGKPFSPRELVSRIKAVLRRVAISAHAEDAILKIDEHLAIDFRRREAIVRGERVRLRPTEWRLLYHLVHNAGWVMTYDMLLAKVWGREYRGADHYVRLYINYLRQKIEPNPSHPTYILTERGVGYRFVDFRRQTTDIRHQTSDVRQQTSDVRHQTSDVRHQTSDVRQQTSDVRHQTSDVRHQTSDVRHQTSDVRQQTSDVRQQTSDDRQQRIEGA